MEKLEISATGGRFVGGPILDQYLEDAPIPMRLDEEGQACNTNNPITCCTEQPCETDNQITCGDADRTDEDD